MKIYFAASIRGGREDQENYARILGLLRSYGTVLTEHVGSAELTAHGQYEHTDEAIFARDTAFLEECDAIVAEVSTPSLGVGYEIGRMEGTKPILCLLRAEADRPLSSMLAGNPGLSIVKYRDLKQVEKSLEKFFGRS
jgi:nucleoside 2-deoxyribosyltransferase